MINKRSRIAIVIAVSSTFTFLGGCAAGMAPAIMYAPMAIGVVTGYAQHAKAFSQAKPKMTYLINSQGEIEIFSETWSSNFRSVQASMLIAASIVAEKRGCTTIAQLFNNFNPDPTMPVKTRARGIYACYDKSAGGQNIAVLRDRYPEYYETIDSNNLLTAKQV